MAKARTSQRRQRRRGHQYIVRKAIREAESNRHAGWRPTDWIDGTREHAEPAEMAVLREALGRLTPTTARSSRCTSMRAIRSTKPPESCGCRSTPFDPVCARHASGCAVNSGRPPHDPDPASDDRRAPGPPGPPAADRAGRRCRRRGDAGGDDDGGGRLPRAARWDRRTPNAAARRGRIAHRACSRRTGSRVRADPTGRNRSRLPSPWWCRRSMRPRRLHRMRRRDRSTSSTRCSRRDGSATRAAPKPMRVDSVARAHGSGSRTRTGATPGALPGKHRRRSILDVSAAGDAMVFMAPAHVDGQPVSGTHLAELGPAGDVVATRVISHEVLDDGCDGLCAFDSAFAFSPDGTRLAYVRASRQGEEDYATVIAIQEVASGEVVELDSTRASGPDGSNEAPVWSPDGRQILFTRESIGVATPDHRLRARRPSSWTATEAIFGNSPTRRCLVGMGPGRPTARRSHSRRPSPGSAWTSSASGRTSTRTATSTRCAPTARMFGGSRISRLRAWTVAPPCRWAVTWPAGPATGRSCSSCTSGPARGDSTNLPPEVWIMDADGANAGRSMARTWRASRRRGASIARTR